MLAERDVNLTDDVADTHGQAGLLEHLTGDGEGQRLIRLDPPARERPTPGSRWMRTPHDEEPPVPVEHDGSYARHPHTGNASGDEVCLDRGAGGHHGLRMHRKLTVVEPMSAVLGNAIQDVPGPLWCPWPLPTGWLFTGLAYTEHDSSAVAATISSWSGPDLFGDPAELLLVSEEAGAGVGSSLAGRYETYPGSNVGEGSPHARFTVDERPVSLWSVDGGAADRAVYVGEAAGRWLWVIVHPAESGAIVVAPMQLADAHELGAELAVLPVGELSPRLVVA